MNTRSISFRLVAWYAGLLDRDFCVAVCVDVFRPAAFFWKTICANRKSRRARQIANTLLAHVKQTGEPYVASQTKDWYEPEINDRFIRITRADGTLVYVSGTPKDESFDPTEVPALPPSSRNRILTKVEIVGRTKPCSSPR